ncbi:MAG: response regulator [Azospirillaceae bacterium]|nr:response regulator [Azospirillaceae bacterium]
MVRNLLSNALKYTRRGRVLLGCRRHADRLSIEVWDTGIGIPADALQTIFEEYRQLDNADRVRSRGLGLGLSIVQRLGGLLGHGVSVRSRPGRGSVFAIEIALPSFSLGVATPPAAQSARKENAEPVKRTGTILVVEDDPEACELLEVLLRDEGHHVVTAPHADAALELAARGAIRPDLVLSDYDLPGELDGLQMTARLREIFGGALPVIILTGDISTRTLRDIARFNCLRFSKPVKVVDLAQAIQRLLTAPPRALPAKPSNEPPTEAVVFVVDDDAHVRASLREVLEADGRIVRDYASCEAFLDAYRPGAEACLLVDANLPGMTGLELLGHLKAAGHTLPAVMITGNSDVPLAVDAMKAGVSDFIEKPASRVDLLASVDHALERARDGDKMLAWHRDAAGHMAGLTERQRQIMDMVLAGQPSKNIAADLDISQRTVESHRAEIMRRTGAKSLPDLARLALAAAWNGGN